MAIVPLVLAYVVLKFGWFTPGATAKGQFVEQDISVVFDDKENKPLWYLIYQPESQCEQICKEQLYGLNQTYVALGKLQKRVKAQVFTEQLDLQQFSHLSSTSFSHAKLQPEYIYIVDPMGKVIMKYKGSKEREQTIITSKNILADLKKLLNYARVG